MEHVFRKSKANPIITVRDLPFMAHAVLNPGAATHEGETVLLLRIEETDGFSSIFVARSRDGITGWKINRNPLLKRGEPGFRYEEWGCEDPRVTYVPDEQAWYITYTAYSPAGAAVGLARTRDFEEVERIGLIFSPNNKDCVLFPVRFDGLWAALHRPDAGGGLENIWIAYSRDLVFWGRPHAVLLEGMGPAWDAIKVGSGPPPIETDRGWLLIYHGAKYYAGMLVYRVGVALLDRDRPHRVKKRGPKCIFLGDEVYEESGLAPATVFPTGLLLKGDELWMYYGAADSRICLATAKLHDVINVLREADQ